MATHIINDNLFLKVIKKEAFKAKKQCQCVPR